MTRRRRISHDRQRLHELIGRWLDDPDTLDSRETGELVAALRRDPALARRCADLHRAGGVLHRALSLETVDFTERVVRYVCAEAQDTPFADRVVGAAFWRRWSWSRLAAVAALVLVSLTTGWWLGTRTDRDAPRPSMAAETRFWLEDGTELTLAPGTRLRRTAAGFVVDQGRVAVATPAERDRTELAFTMPQGTSRISGCRYGVSVDRDGSLVFTTDTGVALRHPYRGESSFRFDAGGSHIRHRDGTRLVEVDMR